MAGAATLALTAFAPHLGAGQVRHAVDAGAAMVSPDHGYQVKDHVLWDVADPFTITADEGEVEAVVLGTPYERLRYRSYLAHYRHRDLTDAQARADARQLDGHLHILVFAHAPSGAPEDQDFLSRFSAATLAVDGGPTLRVPVSDTFGPAKDAYTKNGTATFLWLGYVDYDLDLSRLPDGVDAGRMTGHLSFTDSEGRDYGFDLDASTFR